MVAVFIVWVLMSNLVFVACRSLVSYRKPGSGLIIALYAVFTVAEVVLFVQCALHDWTYLPGH